MRARKRNAYENGKWYNTDKQNGRSSQQQQKIDNINKEERKKRERKWNEEFYLD